MSERMPIADAIADAETLCQSGVIDVAGDSFNVVVAQMFGRRAVAAITGKLTHTRGADHEARLAAEAAFRAVPALRGEPIHCPACAIERGVAIPRAGTCPHGGA